MQDMFPSAAVVHDHDQGEDTEVPHRNRTPVNKEESKPNFEILGEVGEAEVNLTLGDPVAHQIEEKGTNKAGPRVEGGMTSIRERDDEILHNQSTL